VKCVIDEEKLRDEVDALLVYFDERGGLSDLEKKLVLRYVYDYLNAVIIRDTVETMMRDIHAEVMDKELQKK